MGGFLGIGGSSAKTDRKQTLQGYGDLQNIFNFGMSSGKSQLTAGQGTLGTALTELQGPASYYQKLLSGNRPALLQAIQPAVNAATDQADAQKRQAAASGTARGGGTNATQQQQDTERMAAIDNALASAKGGAAEGEARVAGETASIGGTELNTALNLLGLGSNAASNLTSASIGSRPTSNAINQQTVSQVTSAIDALLGGIF